jgi:hypothetical protein
MDVFIRLTGFQIFQQNHGNKTILQEDVSKMLVAFIIKIALMTEAANTSETSVNFYQTTRRNNPEDNRLHTRGLENQKSHNAPGVLNPGPGNVFCAASVHFMK